MTPHDRHIARLAARYLEAFEADDLATLDALWAAAGADEDLVLAFQQIHAGLLEEEQAAAAKTVADAAEKHLTSAEIVRPVAGTVTVGAVAEELFRHTPDRLPAAAHALNETLRASRRPLPADLGLPSLTAWAEAAFGPAPAEYWAAFRLTAMKVRMRAAADGEFQLAARRTAKPEGRG